MIKEISCNQVAPLLKKFFPSYQVNSDPFEKVVAYYHDEIIAIISYSIIYERAEVNYIIVTEANRHQGFGQKLLDYALADIISYHCQSVSLEVAVDNLPAINLYQKYGFNVKTIRANYYANTNAYLMVKELEVKK